MVMSPGILKLLLISNAYLLLTFLRKLIFKKTGSNSVYNNNGSSDVHCSYILLMLLISTNKAMNRTTKKYELKYRKYL